VILFRAASSAPASAMPAWSRTDKQQKVCIYIYICKYVYIYIKQAAYVELLKGTLHPNQRNDCMCFIGNPKTYKYIYILFF
jgi:hypothetical protein